MLERTHDGVIEKRRGDNVKERREGNKEGSLCKRKLREGKK